MDTVVTQAKNFLTQSTTKFNSPWPFYVEDNFLPWDLLKDIQKEFAHIKAKKQLRHLHDHPFGTQYALCCIPEAYKFLRDNLFLMELSREYDCSFSMSEDQAIQHRTMTRDSEHIFPHHDFGGGYTFGMILYTSTKWVFGQGGEFVAMAGLDPSEQDVLVQPLTNRAIFFYNGVENIHMVKPLNFGERDSLVVEWKVSLI